MATELFELTDLASLLKSDLDAASANLARRIATSQVRSILGGLDPQPDSASVEVYLPADSTQVILPALVNTVESVETSTGSGAVAYDWYGGRELTLHRWQRKGVVKVTYTYDTVPGPVRDAALLIAADVYGPIDAAGGDLSGVESTTDSIDDYSHTVRYSQVSEGAYDTACIMLHPYRRRSASSVRLVI